MLPERQGLTRGDPKLPLDQIDARDDLGHRVLHLQARVHLEEEEPAVLVEELDRARPDVVHRPGRAHRRLAHPPPLRGVQQRRRRLLDQLLVTPLNGAFALVEVHDVAVHIAEELHLDVAGTLQEPLHVDAAVSEGGFGLPHRALEGAADVLRARRTTRIPFPPPPADALSTTGKPDLPGRAAGLVAPRPAVHRGPGHDRHPRRRHPPARLGLVAHGPDRRRRRSHEDEPGVRRRLRRSPRARPGSRSRGGRRARSPGGPPRAVSRRSGSSRRPGPDRPGRLRRRGAHGESPGRAPRRPQRCGFRVRALHANDPERDLAPVGDQYGFEQRRPSREPGAGQPGGWRAARCDVAPPSPGRGCGTGSRSAADASNRQGVS